MILFFSYTFSYTEVKLKIGHLTKSIGYIVSSSPVGGPFTEIALGGLFYCLSLMRFRLLYPFNNSAQFSSLN